MLEKDSGYCIFMNYMFQEHSHAGDAGLESSGAASFSDSRLPSMKSQATELSVKEALTLIQDGARLIGRMVVLRESQLGQQTPERVAVDLRNGTEVNPFSVTAVNQSSLSFYAYSVSDLTATKAALLAQNIITHTLIGITGTIGSGKSAATSILAKKGATVFSADSLARDVVSPGSPGLQQVIAHFGNEYLAADGSLDRKKLGKLVFSDETKREELNAILHPLIREQYLTQLFSHYENASVPGVVAYEVPLLFESKHAHPELEEAVLITALEDICISRIMQRDNCNREDAEQRIQAQMSVEKKKAKATIIVENNGSLEDLSDSLEQLFQYLVPGK